VATFVSADVAAPFTLWTQGERPGGVSVRTPEWSGTTGQLAHTAGAVGAGFTLARAVMVVDIIIGARAHGVRARVAVEPLAIVDSATGIDHSAIGGLVAHPDFAEDYTLGNGASGARSVTITMDPSVLNPRKLIANGVLLHGFAEVSVHLRPMRGPAEWRDRVVLMRGIVDGAKFGALFPLPDSPWLHGKELMELEIVDPRELCQTRLPAWVIGNSDRFTTPHSSAIGGRIPLALNSYNRIPAVRVTTNAVGVQNFVVAAGTDWVVSTSTGVTVNGVVKTSGDATYGWNKTEGQDSTGVRYTYINFTNGATAWSDSDAVHVTVTSESTVEQLNVVKMIRELCVAYGAFGGSGVNDALFAVAESKLPPALAVPKFLANAGGGGNAGTLLDVIENAICESYPMISMVWQDGGYGPILTDYRTAPVMHLIVGAVPIIDRGSLVQASTASAIKNSFVVRYGYDPLLDVFTGVVTRDPTNSAVCAYSQDIVGQRDADPIESIYITDDATASYVADWLVAHIALPSYLVEYEALPTAFFRLRRGDTVELTDPEFGWTQERATVEGLFFSPGKARVTLRVWQRFVDLGGAALSVPAL
jgi:hypothetical protein